MTLETISEIKQYAGNGTTTAFSYPFKFFADGDLVVILTDSSGNETTQTITTNYTVSGAGADAGGTVTMVTAPATGETLTVYRDVAATQDLDLRENDAAPAEEIEKAFDRAAMRDQRVNELFAQKVGRSEGATGTFDLTLPSDLTTANKALVTDSDGDGWAMGPTVDEISNAQTYATNAANSATASANSATASANSATASATSATNAANSATAAETAANSIAWNDVVFLTNSDSPYTLSASDRGKLFSIDASTAKFTFNLLEISGLDLTTPFIIGGKKTDSSSYEVEFVAAGSDQIDGASTKSIQTKGAGFTLIPDTDGTPDQWTSASFGPVSGNMIVDTFSGTGAQTDFTLSADPATENNTFVFVSGVYIEKEDYSVSGTTLSFNSAPASGTDNIQVVSGTTLSIGAPSDGTVSTAKIVDSAVTTAKVADDAITDAKANFTAPTVTRYTSGSGTYTVPAGVKYLVIEMVGGGAGGAGSASGGVSGSNGTASTFGSSLLTANGGTGGANNGSIGGAGGTATINSPATTLVLLQGSSGGGAGTAVSGDYVYGGDGGQSFFGCAGNGSGGVSGADGGNATTQSGSGGGGGGSNNVTTTVFAGAGGGAAGYLKALITSPAASYSYAVGGGGTGGAAGGSAGRDGGDGGSGVIIIWEYYA